MVDARRRISARLQPVAAALASAPGSISSSSSASPSRPSRVTATATATKETAKARANVPKALQNTELSSSSVTADETSSLAEQSEEALDADTTSDGFKRKTKRSATDNLVKKNTSPSKRQKPDDDVHNISEQLEDAMTDSLLESVLPTPSQPTPETQETTEEQGLMQEQFLGHRATNPLELHEIRTNVARFLSRSDIRNCLLVCESWWESFQPYLWIDLRPVYRNVLGGTNDYPSCKLMRKYGHLIRTFEYNGHGTVLLSMISCENMYDMYYKNEDIEWHKTEEEEAEEESWMYADDDMDPELSLNQSESLSDFEGRIERNSLERRERMARMKDVKAANKRQNEVSRFLNDDTDYRKRVCNNIERLIFTDKRFSRERGCHYRNWIKLMQLNQAHLRSLELTFAIRSFDAYREIFTQIVSLENLTELTLVDNDIDNNKVKPFLETICIRLTKLELSNVRIDYGILPGQISQNAQGVPEHQILRMEKMRTLTFFRVNARNDAFALEFLKQCPNLTDLAFRPQWGMSMKEFSGLLSEKLSGVTHLTFRAPGSSDMDMSLIIKSLPMLQKLNVSGTTFGLMATNMLSTRHTFTLSYLDLRVCSQVTGSMIQRILGESRNLKVFFADVIRAKDIVTNSVYPTWACIGLRELTLDIRGDPNDTEIVRKVYKQLAQLTCLEHLDISQSSHAGAAHSFPPEEKSNCLTLKLGSGLRELRTLVHMNRLVYRGIARSEVGLAELQWMAKAWPQLGQIGGKLKSRKLSYYNPNVHPKEEREPTPACECEHDNNSGNGSDDIGTNSAIYDSASAACGRMSRRSGILYLTGETNIAPAVSNPGGGTSNTVNVASSSLFTSDASSSHSMPSVSRTTVANNSNSENSSNGRSFITDANPKRKPPFNKVKHDAPPNLLAQELRRLNLHHRIKVIWHYEDRVPASQRKRQRLLQGESSDDDMERLRPGQLDPRYRGNFRDFI
ncbi:hypothetical protein BC939DRAFT_452737 [Gamsiella multidivaricata]|uniref:uncharacterized protein n=1 Tax=Gamsiella multidivaricata TaxID=101098 RepID=UPI0022206455|nr:uncharacterized protein BC939DRAFT_452737 [Gamsiella multidivaricata]KAG0365181.1 hypothetical protein BGZ54_006783 [Gamsiella multidivaricata]KAI7822838.1 hypothetical protein BC939DRAFT_452737 [Gamsiella multidivaricata]